MNHSFSDWTSKLEQSFQERNSDELEIIKTILTEIPNPTSQTLREVLNKSTHLYVDKDRLKISIAVLKCATFCREPYPEDYKTLCAILKIVLKARLPLSHEELLLFLKFLADLSEIDPKLLPVTEVIGQIETNLISAPIPTDWQPLLEKVYQTLDASISKKTKPLQSLLKRISDLSSNSIINRLKPDEGWVDLMRQDVGQMEEAKRRLWEKLLSLMVTVKPEPPRKSWDIHASVIEPEDMLNFDMEEHQKKYWEEYNKEFFKLAVSTQWRHLIDEQIEEIGLHEFNEFRAKWLQSVVSSKPGTLSQLSINRELLRGLIWTAENSQDNELARLLRIVAESLFRRNSPLGLTCVRMLASIKTPECLEELSHLFNQVKAETQRNPIEGARALLADQIGISSADLNDLPLPDSGFTELGKRVEILSGFRAELVVTEAGNVELNWYKPNGQPQKSVPAKVKREHTAKLSNLKTTAKEVKSTLSTAHQRIESAYLKQLSWDVDHWRERYIDHPIAGTLGRRLIWQVEQEGEVNIIGFDNKNLVDVEGQSQELSPAAKVTLWHPLNQESQETLAWREWLMTHKIRQPFKQAHREIYLLTDAERTTENYSNRFAAHIVRQSRFRTLAKTRGWKSEYLGNWDTSDNCFSTKELPEWGLRAEFSVAWASEETANAGGFFFLTTDQVKFYPQEGHVPLNLEQVPPLPFSEIMRDVDLFIGVCSLGNDPNWQNGAFEPYWQTYSFGELSETAITRREVLKQIIPRLKIADQCSFADRFLFVRGNLRTYRIHLGSSNILMEPNEEYLCIVPQNSSVGNFFLPFEGDERLSVILSKAFLHADDSSITDPTIMNQIQRKE